MWRNSAEQGNAEAQFWLGGSYQQGEGVPQDYVQAHMWFNLSASNSSGEDQAQRAEARDEVASKMTPGQIARSTALSSGMEADREVLYLSFTFTRSMAD